MSSLPVIEDSIRVYGCANSPQFHLVQETCELNISLKSSFQSR